MTYLFCPSCALQVDVLISVANVPMCLADRSVGVCAAFNFFPRISCLVTQQSPPPLPPCHTDVPHARTLTLHAHARAHARYFEVLLLTAQFDRAIAFLLSERRLELAVHFAIPLEHYGLLNCQPFQIPRSPADRESAARALGLVDGESVGACRWIPSSEHSHP